MRFRLAFCLVAAAERIQQLEAELYSLMAAEEQRCLEAMAAAAAGTAGAGDAFQFNPSQSSTAAARALFNEADPSAAAVAAAAGGDAPAASKGSLFNSSSLQLVPPTPMLQQLVQRHCNVDNRQQSAAEAAAHAAWTADAYERAPDAADSPEGVRERSCSPPIPPAAEAGLVSSPRLDGIGSRGESTADAASCSSTASSVSSKSMPAAALLMSQVCTACVA